MPKIKDREGRNKGEGEEENVTGNDKKTSSMRKKQVKAHSSIGNFFI